MMFSTGIMTLADKTSGLVVVVLANLSSSAKTTVNARMHLAANLRGGQLK